jgi:UDP-N-acetylmuramyl pentapeptide synthase
VNGPDVAVMELGMNHAGEISTLVAIAEPEVRVWINVGDAHIGFFESADAIAEAKAEILERAASGSCARLQRRRPPCDGSCRAVCWTHADVRDVAGCNRSRDAH